MSRTSKFIGIILTTLILILLVVGIIYLVNHNSSNSDGFNQSYFNNKSLIDVTKDFIAETIIDQAKLQANNLAFGVVRNALNPYICAAQEQDTSLGLSICSQNPVLPERSQFFILTPSNYIKDVYGNRCWNHLSTTGLVGSNPNEVSVNLVPFRANDEENVCSKFKYDHVKQTIVDLMVNSCLTAIYSVDESHLKLKQCVDGDDAQKWTWGFLNTTFIEKFV